MACFFAALPPIFCGKALPFRQASLLIFSEAAPRNQQGTALPEGIKGTVHGKAEPFRTFKRQSRKSLINIL